MDHSVTIWRCPRGHDNKASLKGDIVCDECSVIYPIAEGIYVTNIRKPLNDASSSRDPLLVEREKMHGSFAKSAEYSQRLKEIFDEGLPLRAEHKEALDMIALKLSRILSGRADFKDHWDDIAGYAKLASEACK